MLTQDKCLQNLVQKRESLQKLPKFRRQFD